MAVATNPFRPGAGQDPVYLAGRTKEQDQFERLLKQSPILENAILTGLRGVGKTVLLRTFKPISQKHGWLWTGNDLSESASLTEERIAIRIITDLSILLSPIFVHQQETLPLGFHGKTQTIKSPLSFDDLWKIFETTPGLVEDKLKTTLLHVRGLLESAGIPGVVFAYDEAQIMSDHAAVNQYPLSLLLDVFSFLQRQQSQSKFLLVLTGLPTLFPRLNEARTYTERMFHVMYLDKLGAVDSRMAIEKPIELTKSRLQFSNSTISSIVKMSGGYPYFIQYICKEVFDAWIDHAKDGQAPSVPSAEIIRKLDQDFFSPRWERATDRQQEFMQVIATLSQSGHEFSAQEIAVASKDVLQKGFSPSHAVQILQNLAEKGLIYRNTKYGKYSFAVPLLAEFIQRQMLKGASRKPG